jgi:hypothetical protein
MYGLKIWILITNAEQMNGISPQQCRVAATRYACDSGLPEYTTVLHGKDCGPQPPVGKSVSFLHLP